MVTERDLRFLEFDPSLTERQRLLTAEQRRILEASTGVSQNILQKLIVSDEATLQASLNRLLNSNIITEQQGSNITKLWRANAVTDEEGVLVATPPLNLPTPQDFFPRPTGTGRFTEAEQRRIDERQFLENLITDAARRSAAEVQPAESLSSVFQGFADELAGGNANFRSFLDRQFPAIANRFGAAGQQSREGFTRDPLQSFDRDVANLQLQQLTSRSLAERTQAGTRLSSLQERGARQEGAEDPFLTFLKQGQFREQFQNLAPAQRGVSEKRFKPRTRFFRF